MKNKKLLYKIDVHPYLEIRPSGKKLIIRFQDGISSYSKWHTVEVKFIEKDNMFVLITRDEK